MRIRANKILSQIRRRLGFLAGVAATVAIAGLVAEKVCGAAGFATGLGCTCVGAAGRGAAGATRGLTVALVRGGLISLMVLVGLGSIV